MRQSKKVQLIQRLGFVVTVLSLEPALGDSLTAESSKDTYYLFEPIVVNVRLHLDEPFVRVRDDPLEATRQRRRLRRNLDAELRDGQDVLCEAALSTKFDAREDHAMDLYSTGVGILGEMMRDGDDVVFRFWATAGDYTLVVLDRDHRLESNEVSISIVAPEGDAVPASELFRSGGLATVPALVGIEYGEKVRPVFEQLAKEHPDTVYGKYAKVGLALLHAEALRNRRVKAEPGTYPALAKDLKEAITLFEAGHPLRSRALWHLARTQRAPTVAGDPEETIRQLLSETNDGQMIREARDFLKEMARHRQKAPENTGNDSQD